MRIHFLALARYEAVKGEQSVDPVKAPIGRMVWMRDAVTGVSGDERQGSDKGWEWVNSMRILGGRMVQWFRRGTRVRRKAGKCEEGKS